MASHGRAGLLPEERVLAIRDSSMTGVAHPAGHLSDSAGGLVTGHDGFCSWAPTSIGSPGPLERFSQGTSPR